MEKSCINCENKEICKYFSDARENLEGLRSYVFFIKKKTWELWISELPSVCRSFKEKKVYDIRDSSGVLLKRKPLKIWYPDQKPKEKFISSREYYIRGEDPI